MPSVCVRTMSPRNTLPRSTPKRKAMKKATALPTTRKKDDCEDELATPMASAFDVRGEPSSMSSSVVLESRNSSNPSPSESRDIMPDFAAPKQMRCLSKATKAKRLRFYRNGDQYFKGISYALHTDRIRSMKPLMEDLRRAMGDSQNLPHGIRHIFTIDGQYRITEVDQFEDGESYVCSSTEVFKMLDYANAKEPAWCFNLSKPGRSLDVSVLNADVTGMTSEPTDFVEPRIVTVIRNGLKPRRVIRHLLNKRTARSFDQVIRDLTSVVKLDTGAIRKLYGLSGKQVACLRDFFVEDYVFIAYGTEKHSIDDILVISEDYRRSSNSTKSLRSVRRKHAMPSRNESLREDRCGSVVPDELARHLPGELTGTFSVVRLLGDGNTALVYEVIENETNERKALKFIARENTVGKEALIASELEIMKAVDHDKIVKLFAHWEIEGSHFLSLELIEGGDLFEYLCTMRRIPEQKTAQLSRCLFEALSYLHEKSIVHRDVKPENLLLYQHNNEELFLKLADFGLATMLPQEGDMLNVVCGTPTYVAPEVLMLAGYDERVDVWAAGVIMYVMLCGFPPFQSSDGSQDELFQEILRGKFGFPSPAWDNISWTAKHLILSLVTIDVDERPPALEALKYSWVQTNGKLCSDFESMSQFAVESKLHNMNEQQDVDVEETEREYYFSRRTSMDELSESGGEFTFTRSYS